MTTSESQISRERASLKTLIEEAKAVHKYTLMSNSADHYREDHMSAWRFVRKVAKMEVE